MRACNSAGWDICCDASKVFVHSNRENIVSEIPPAVHETVEPPVAGTPAYRLPTGFATAAFVLGLCGFIPLLGMLLGLLAVVFGIIALARSVGCGRKGFAIAGIVIGAVTMIVQPILLVAVVTPAVQRASELANQAACMANLNGIGKAVAMYQAEDRNARYPENIEALIERGLITRDAFDCRSARRLGRERSYFHFFPKSGSRMSGSTFMFCDVKGNHPDGRTVLYISGAIDFLSEEEFQSQLTEPRNADFARAMKDAGVE